MTRYDLLVLDTVDTVEYIDGVLSDEGTMSTHMLRSNTYYMFQSWTSHSI
jgi:hypothetical protein